MTHSCTRCQKQFNDISNYKRHITRKTPCVSDTNQYTVGLKAEIESLKQQIQTLQKDNTDLQNAVWAYKVALQCARKKEEPLNET